jgi:AcrR family transcriptional regulator
MTGSPSKAHAVSRFSVRKGPRQERSRVTVESIMQATLELIAKDGFHTLTTTKIAERAGISVGSLYEYFPNREAILLSLYESTSSRVANVARKVIVDILDMPIEKGIPKSIEALLVVHGANRLILLDMVTEMPELKLITHPISYDSLMRSAISTYLQHFGVQMTPKELERRLFFIKQIVMGCIRQYLQHPPSRLSRREFVDDLSRILVPYIKEVSAQQ